MVRRSLRHWASLTILGLAAGCHYGASRATEQYVTAESYPVDMTLPAEAPTKRIERTAGVVPPAAADDPVRPGGARFAVPQELPGADAPALQLPEFDRSTSRSARRSALSGLFPVMPELTDTADTAGLQTVSLGELQDWALTFSPVIRQAAADVELARGQAVQAGLYPNPTVGYEGDSLGTANTGGYNGVMVTQEFVTAGKLSLAQSAAMMEVQAAQQDLRKARIGLASDIRRGYFSVLIAQERVKYSTALASLANQVYEAHVDLVAGGEVAPYEPLQLRVFALQARNSVTQAQNELQAAWRQLAATLGAPEMAQHEVLGSAETPAPAIDYDAAVALMLSQHTDLAAAGSRISSAGYHLELQEVTPIPNITVYGAFQHDDTTPLNDFAANIQVGVPVPFFDRNQGNITSAHAKVVRANQDWIDARNTLTSALAEAYNRYASNRIIAESYRTEILPDQVRVYRGVYDRFRAAGDSNDFAQVVVSQQTLATAINQYLQSLGDQWQATVDMAELLQTEDLFMLEAQVGPTTFLTPDADTTHGQQ